MKVLVRNADLKDVDFISNLTQELGYKTTIDSIKNQLAEILKNDDNCVFVAVQNEKIIGWIHGFYALRIESASFVEIGGLVVTKKHWKKGIEKMLVERVIKWSESKKCKKIRVRCNRLRTESHKFYEKIEFKLNKEQKIFDFLIRG